MRRTYCTIATLAVLLIAPVLLAAVPQQIAYQGYLTDAGGTPLNGPVILTFKIYDAVMGGAVLWNSGGQAVTCTDGVFSIYLGASPMPALSNSVFGDSIRYLGITVGADPELSPRTRLVSAPYAYRVGSVDGASGGSITGDLAATGTVSAGNSIVITGGVDRITAASGTFDFNDDNLRTQGQAGVGMVTWPWYGAINSHTSTLPYSISATSAFASNGFAIDVIRAEYTGSDTAIAVLGRSAPADHVGTGGLFVGGATGVEGDVIAAANTTGLYYNGVVGYASSFQQTTNGDFYGVNGFAHAQHIAYGVYGFGQGHVGQGTAYGVYGTANGGAVNWAAYFAGNVHVNGTLSKMAGSFKIDHPLDPAQKYLQHSFVESPDMMNIYNGNAILNDLGGATIVLPDWFEALNKDFRYQLTCIGGFAPVYIAEKISGNQFKIGGGKPGMEVSWQVTGIRHDAYAEAHRVQVEIDKTGDERGKYLSPIEHGQPIERGIDYGHQEATRDLNAQHESQRK